MWRAASHTRIKNPLTPIQLSAERLKRRYGKQIDQEDRTVFDQCTDTIVRQVEDIGRMVDESSSFARMPKPTKERSDLRAILKDAVFLREMGNTEISFIRDFGDEPLDGFFDSRMLGQAFGNIVKNAVEAIEALPAEAGAPASARSWSAPGGRAVGRLRGRHHRQRQGAADREPP